MVFIKHQTSDDVFHGNPGLFQIDVIGGILLGYDVIKDAHRRFTGEELGKRFQNLVSQTFPPERRSHFHIHQVITGNRFFQVNHVEASEIFPAFRLDFEHLKSVLRIRKFQSVDPSSLCGGPHQFPQVVKKVR